MTFEGVGNELTGEKWKRADLLNDDKAPNKANSPFLSTNEDQEINSNAYDVDCNLCFPKRKLNGHKIIEDGPQNYNKPKSTGPNLEIKSESCTETGSNEGKAIVGPPIEKPDSNESVSSVNSSVANPGLDEPVSSLTCVEQKQVIKEDVQSSIRLLQLIGKENIVKIRGCMAFWIKWRHPSRLEILCHEDDVEEAYKAMKILLHTAANKEFSEHRIWTDRYRIISANKKPTVKYFSDVASNQPQIDFQDNPFTTTPCDDNEQQTLVVFQASSQPDSTVSPTTNVNQPENAPLAAFQALRQPDSEVSPTTNAATPFVNQLSPQMYLQAGQPVYTVNQQGCEDENFRATITCFFMDDSQTKSTSIMLATVEHLIHWKSQLFVRIENAPYRLDRIFRIPSPEDRVDCDMILADLPPELSEKVDARMRGQGDELFRIKGFATEEELMEDNAIVQMYGCKSGFQEGQITHSAVYDASNPLSFDYAVEISAQLHDSGALVVKKCGDGAFKAVGLIIGEYKERYATSERVSSSPSDCTPMVLLYSLKKGFENFKSHHFPELTLCT